MTQSKSPDRSASVNALVKSSSASRRSRGSSNGGVGTNGKVSRIFVKNLPLLHQARAGNFGRISGREFRLQFMNNFLNHWNEIKAPEWHNDSEPDISVDEIRVQTPHEIIADKIEKVTQEILQEMLQNINSSPSNIENQAKSVTEIAYERRAEVPKFEDLCKEFESYRDEYCKEFVDSKSYKSSSSFPIRLINSITRSTLQNRADEVEQKLGFEPVAEGEVIFRIAVYDMRSKVQSQEFLVLGSQKLSDLKDAIHCLSDAVYGDSITRSSYFLIEDTFYDDMRDIIPPPAAVRREHEKKEKYEALSLDSFQNRAKEIILDFSGSKPVRYSDTIIEWVKQKKRFTQPGLTRFRQSEMDLHKLEDIPLRLNSFYYFCHQGNCCHVLLIHEIRMFNSKKDFNNRNLYPFLIYEPRLKRRKCGVCDIYPSKFVTYGDRQAPESPFFYCSICYQQFHYDASGNILYDDFEVFPYFHE